MRKVGSAGVETNTRPGPTRQLSPLFRRNSTVCTAASGEAAALRGETLRPRGRDGVGATASLNLLVGTAVVTPALVLGIKNEANGTGSRQPTTATDQYVGEWLAAPIGNRSSGAKNFIAV
jgi:hypothetical protein